MIEKMDGKKLISLLNDLLYIRLVEERIAELYPEQEIRCPVHLSIGQEAIAVGVCKNLKKDDLVFSNHRCHAHYLAKGGSLKKFFAEMYGKSTGCSKGKGGSMHIIDLTVNFMGSVPVVAATIPIAVGAAFTLSKKESKNISVVFMGDAAIEEGVFHESINFAKLKNLPVLFVCENNLYSVYTPIHLRQPKRKIVDVVKAQGLECYSVDGNDVSAVHDVSKKAIDRIRKGKGPAFIEACTYRWREHCGVNYDDHLGYRCKDEILKWKSKDPIKRLKENMMSKHMITQREIKEIEEKIKKDIDEAVKFAKSSPFPDKSDLHKHIYD